MTDTRHSLVTTQSITEYLQLHDYSSMGHGPWHLLLQSRLCTFQPIN